MEKPSLKPTFIRAWRIDRELSQEQLAEAVDMTTASLSRIENGKQPYTQRTLELLAQALRCEPADLLAKDPNQRSVADIVDIVEHIPMDKRDQARRILETFTERKKA